MSFEKLIRKVHQAEDALEARERQVSSDIRQFKRSWRLAWTPGRIVVAGLLTGFASGRAEPVHTVSRGGGILRILSMVSTLMAGTGARDAANEAEQAAESAEQVAATAPVAASPHDPFAS